MAQIASLNAHEIPPEAIRRRYKQYQALKPLDIDADPTIVDLNALDPNNLPNDISLARWMSSDEVQPVFNGFLKTCHSNVDSQPRTSSDTSIPVFTHRSVSGLLMIPSLFPPAVQIELLSRLFHRDLSDSAHRTNLHLHYDFTYPVQTNGVGGQGDSSSSTNSPGNNIVSFFADDPARTLRPKDPQIHKPLTIENVLKKKLRWVTLGGQYDWTAKVYPDELPPAFPADIADLLRPAFPETAPEAAILNVYSPGNTLSPHRDVSEECDAGLISVSFGCDGLFLISHDDGSGCEIIRLRSGDAVYMDGTSRFAWHAVPKIIEGTCPSWLADWPSCPTDGMGSFQYESWKGWMSSKRINLNVRQMVAPSPENRASNIYP